MSDPCITTTYDHRTGTYTERYNFQQGFQEGLRGSKPKQKEPEVPKTEFEITGDLLDAIDNAEEGLADADRTIRVGILCLVLSVGGIAAGWATWALTGALGVPLTLLIIGGIGLLGSGCFLFEEIGDFRTGRASWKKQLRRATRDYERHLTKDM